MDPQNPRESSARRTLRVPDKEYWAFHSAPLPPALKWTPALMVTLSDTADGLGELKRLRHSLTNPHLLIAPFIQQREVASSSRIEGTQASLSDLY
jgi:hypothetical protein